MRDIVPFLIGLFLIAAIFREDAIITVLYLMVGAYLGGRWWSQRALGAMTYARSLPHRAFLGETIRVRITVRNTGWLPVVWLRLQESLPAELAQGERFRQVTRLGPYEAATFAYELHALKRGYYRIGPLFLSSGDILGLVGEQEREGKPDYLTIYPLIVPLRRVTLPSSSPLGTLRHRQPIFEDPSRIVGKRDYYAGDSLRRIDWKATAVAGRLQVKLFEPSIALETFILLNLHAGDYEFRSRIDTTELAIVVAASLANWISEQKQSVGFTSNGRDPLHSGGQIAAVPARKGRGHLMRVLDILARIQVVEGEPFTQLIRRQTPHLSWGTTVILISGQIDEPLFDVLFQARRAGLKVVLILCGFAIGRGDLYRRAQQFGIVAHLVQTARDLDRWRQRSL